MDTDKNTLQKKVPEEMQKKGQALKDPVCGMTVTAQSTHHLKHNNKSFYFCSVSCKNKFKDNPDRYSTKATGAKQSSTSIFEKMDAVQKPSTSLEANVPAIATTGVIYTCPMHPEVRQNHPGN